MQISEKPLAALEDFFLFCVGIIQEHCQVFRQMVDEAAEKPFGKYESCLKPNMSPHRSSQKESTDVNLSNASSAAASLCNK